LCILAPASRRIEPEDAHEIAQTLLPRRGRRSVRLVDVAERVPREERRARGGFSERPQLVRIPALMLVYRDRTPRKPQAAPTPAPAAEPEPPPPSASGPERAVWPARLVSWAPAVLGAYIAAQCAFGVASTLASFAVGTAPIRAGSSSGREKTPREAWAEYGPEFRRHATDVITPEFLAGLAQVESAGDPLARQPYVWRLTTDVTRLYSPLSSAVGLMQITDANFEDARRFCRDGGCSSRLEPAQAIEMTSGFLHYHVARLVARSGRPVALRDRQKLAAVIHLCGPEKGASLVDSGFDPDALGSCGDQPVGPYVRRVMAYAALFARWKNG
jgi:hypothetical protein